MKSGSLFWGFFFISLGACFLLYNFDLLNLSGLSLGYMWPILLIVFGISLLKLSEGWKKLLSAISGLLFALVVVGTVTGGIHFFKDTVFNDNYGPEFMQKTSYYVYYDKDDKEIKQAILNFQGGAGEFELKEFSDTAGILKAKTYALKSECKDYFNEDSIFTVDFVYNHNLNTITNITSQNMAELKLRDNIQWEININTGACEMDLDFDNLAVNQLNIQTGASSIDIDLGNKADTCYVSVQNGVSEINIDVPDNVLCRIYSKTALSSKSFVGFVNNGDYFEAVPETETKKYIEISIEGGVSDYYIKRSHR